MKKVQKMCWERESQLLCHRHSTISLENKKWEMQLKKLRI